MEQVLEILQGLHPEIDLKPVNTLIDDKILIPSDIATPYRIK